jgi:hypothetical protein
MRASVISAAVALALLWAAPAAFGQAVTAVTVTTSPSPSRVGEPVQLSARVTVPQAPTTTPTGTVQFEVDGAPVGTPVALSNGVAGTTTANLAVGTRSIVARYHSDAPATFADSTGTAGHVVNRWSSQAGLAVAPEPAVAGQPVTFSASVGGQTAGGQRPTGTVQFTDEGDGPIGPPVALDAQGVAHFTGRAGAGTYRVRADYGGDGTFTPSSATVTSTVQRAATATTLTSSANPAAPGAEVVFTINVAIVPPGDVAPFGSVQITINGQPAGDPIPLEGYDGLTLTVRAPLAARNDVIGVSYSGDQNTLPSSASLNQVVAVPTTNPTTRPSAGVTVTPAQLKRMTAPLITRLKRRGARALNGARLTFSAPTAGTLQQTVRAGSLLASAKRTFSAAGRGTLTLRLTAAGRRQLRRTNSVKLTIVTTFTPSGGTPVRVTERVTVRRSGRASAAWQVVASRLTRE